MTDGGVLDSLFSLSATEYHDANTVFLHWPRPAQWCGETM